MLDLPTPYQVVREHFSFLFELYPFQIEAVNELAPRPRTGLWLDMGTGKTIVSIHMALYKIWAEQVEQVIVLMPPILLANWSRTLAGIPGITQTVYRGSPKQRAEMDLSTMFVLMSYQIFCKDYDHLGRNMLYRRNLVICDESTAIKNVDTQTYKRVRDWSYEQHIILLSGSPLSSPADGYAPIKTIAPNIYRNQAQYERTHVKSRDFFGNVEEWQNLDLLHSNLMVNAVRVLKTDVLKELPPVSYIPVFYELDATHMKTYRRLCEDQMLKFDDGTKLDVTAASALFHALQQIPLNREVFTQEEGKLSAGVELIEEVLQELDGGKLVIFTAYRATNRMLSERLKKYGVVAVYGEVSRAAQDAAIDRFVDDPTCRVILLQIRSGSYGIDRLQSVCHDVLFAEMPLVPAHFHQAVARIWRNGQESPVSVRVSIAENTIQVRLWDVLQAKDSLVNLCIRGFKDLRDAVAGRSHDALGESHLSQEVNFDRKIIDANRNDFDIPEQNANDNSTCIGWVDQLVHCEVPPASNTHVSEQRSRLTSSDISALECRIATINASLPVLAAIVAAAEEAWENASKAYVKRNTLQIEVEKATRALNDAEAMIESFTYISTLSEESSAVESSNTCLSWALEDRKKAEQLFAKAQQALSEHECPTAEALREITEARNDANLKFNAAKNEILLAEQQVTRLSLT